MIALCFGIGDSRLEKLNITRGWCRVNMAVALLMGILATIVNDCVGGILGEAVQILGVRAQVVSQVSGEAGLSILTQWVNSPPPRRASKIYVSKQRFLAGELRESVSKLLRMLGAFTGGRDGNIFLPLPAVFDITLSEENSGDLLRDLGKSSVAILLRYLIGSLD